MKNTVKVLGNEIIIDHEVYTTEGFVPVSELIGKEVVSAIYPPDHDELYLKLGFIQGDSCLTAKGKLPIYFNQEKDEEVKELFGFDGHTLFTNEYRELLKVYGFDRSILPERNLPREILSMNVPAFLCGLYSANGCTTKAGTIKLRATNKQIVLDVQELLFDLGIKSKIYEVKASTSYINGRKVNSKTRYDLIVSRYEDRVEFMSQIGFIQEYKNKQITRKVTSLKDMRFLTENRTGMYFIDDMLIKGGV